MVSATGYSLARLGRYYRDRHVRLLARCLESGLLPPDTDVHLRTLEQLAEEQQRALWGSQEFYRAYSIVNGGRKLETDLFEGLR